MATVPWVTNINLGMVHFLYFHHFIKNQEKIWWNGINRRSIKIDSEISCKMMLYINSNRFTELNFMKHKYLSLSKKKIKCRDFIDLGWIMPCRGYFKSIFLLSFFFLFIDICSQSNSKSTYYIIFQHILSFYYHLEKK